MKLSTGKLTVVGIYKKTSSKIFKDLKFGDEIEIYLPLKKLHSRGGSCYSPMFIVENTKTHERDEKVLNIMYQSLMCFEWEEVSNE